MHPDHVLMRFAVIMFYSIIPITILIMVRLHQDPPLLRRSQWGHHGFTAITVNRSQSYQSLYSLNRIRTDDIYHLITGHSLALFIITV